MKTAKGEAGIIRKDLPMPLWCGIEPRTPLPGAWGAALLLVFQRDEAGKGLEDTGRGEQRAGFWLGSSCLGCGSAVAEGVAVGERKQSVVTLGM